MVCVGVITGAHGVRGQVRVKSFTAEPLDVAHYGPLYDEGGLHPLRLTITGRSRQLLIARIDGIGDRVDADGLKGRRLHVPREMLPPTEDDEFYHVDLIGLAAEVANEEVAGADEIGSRSLGKVIAVHDFGAGDVVEIEGDDGTIVMVPFTRDAVPEVDLSRGRLVVVPIPGLLGEEAEPGAPGTEGHEEARRRDRAAASAIAATKATR